MNSSNGKFIMGETVVVTSHRHPDVLAGTNGKIDCFHEGGYGVEINGSWMVAGNDRGLTTQETRVCWYPAEELNHKI